MDPSQISDSTHYSQSKYAAKPTPPWIYAVAVFALPLSGVLSYYAFAYWRRRSGAKQPSNPAVAISTSVPDVERQTQHKPRSSIGKWSALSIPHWPRANRRGSDGGFPPETRRIGFPDPSLAGSTDSLDQKAPSKPPGLPVVSPVTFRYPTPPPPVALQPGKRY
ncbi:hypothetical protein FRC08_003726 [Ceratobasidium sp. 394]|nr:hypothetical protein FRC08_003726 [Ceratobasidium sp. 394]